MSLALLFSREFFKVLGGLKELLACFVDCDPLDNGPNFLCLPAILGSFRKLLDRHV